MAFLDNSGDIILDAVLTDTGRFRLAKGDGSFKIVKFALSDDEINYRLYDKNNPSGSAYYDLEILQTPVMEAFTNNTSTMNYKLLSMPRTNLLYLPMMKLCDLDSQQVTMQCRPNTQNTGFVVTCTQATMGDTNDVSVLNAGSNQGILNGITPGASRIRADQGIDNAAISYTNELDVDLKETQYIIEIDSRLGSIVSPGGATAINAAVSFIDDDNIASYYVSDADRGEFVTPLYNNDDNNVVWAPGATRPTDPAGLLTILGPQGTSLQFRIKATLEVQSSNYLFETLGSTLTDNSDWGFSNANNYLYIDTIVKITGATTGYKLAIPVRFVKRI